MAPGDTRRARPRLRVSACDERGRPLAGSLARWLSAVAPATARGAVSIAVVGDARVRALNRAYRRKDYATDVLSFPSGYVESGPAEAGPHVRSGSHVRSAEPQSWGPALAGPSGGPSGVRYLGDIVIARGVAKRQARKAGHAERTELRVLALHGLLHLLGYDHERDSGEMAQLERRLRRKGGLREGLIERP
ncbi:MAG TPA: rRNA maturation RNase YbeY [Vicinamibacterales bacterium]|nr:rRNA maturation RNase YbeY [Vicinamibacterales bacterium]